MRPLRKSLVLLALASSLAAALAVSAAPAQGGLISGLIGASSLISLPFYLNYGLTKERLIATGSVHSLFIQVTKLATYSSIGILSSRSLLEGIIGGFGAVCAILVTRRSLNAMSEIWFRRLAVLLMLVSGISMLWHPAAHILSHLGDGHG